MESQERIGVGGIISGRYRILQILGKGGVGFVYLAEDAVLKGQHVAIKVLYPDHEEAEFHRNRFFREVSLTRNLESSNIIRTYDVGQDGPALYYTMEVLQGQTLSELLKANNQITFEQVLDMLVQSARGLEVIHGAEIIHRDVKPSNLFVTDAGVVKLMDFGLARPQNSQLTQSSATPGSAAYMPPEIWQGNTATKESDLYSFGITAFELLAGQHPFPSDSVANMMYNHLRTVPPTLKDLIPDVPPKLSQLIAGLLEKDPEKRPESATEVIRCFQEVLDNKARWSSILVRPIKAISGSSASERSERGRRKVFTSVYLMAGCAVLGVVLGVITVSLQRESRRFQDSTQHAVSQGTEPVTSKAPVELRKAILWLNAGTLAEFGKNRGEPVAIWKHASGDQEKAGVMQAFPDWRPRFNYAGKIPVVSFDGKSHFFESKEVVSQLKYLKSMTVFSLLRAAPFLARDANSRKQRFVWSAQLPYNDMVLARMGFNSLNGVRLNFSSEGRNANFDSQPIAGIKNFHLYTLVLDRKVGSLFVDGEQTKAVQINQPLAFRDVSRFVVGQDIDQMRQKTRFTDFFRGDIAELILIGSRLSDERRRELERMLSAKYSLKYNPDG